MLIRRLSVHDHRLLMKSIRKLYERSPEVRRNVFTNVQRGLDRAFSERSYERLTALEAMMLDEFDVELFCII